jgi:hypothetical protein
MCINKTHAHYRCYLALLQHTLFILRQHLFTQRLIRLCGKKIRLVYFFFQNEKQKSAAGVTKVPSYDEVI